MIITKTCILCSKESEVTVKEVDYMAWRDGVFIQNVMPYLTPDQRELLISGICGNCFDDLFPEED